MNLAVYEKVDERTAVAKYKVTPVDTKWVDTDKAFEEGADADPFTNFCQRIQKWRQDRDLYAGTPPLEALKSYHTGHCCESQFQKISDE